MRYPASEKLEIIKLVEQSHLTAKRTLDQLGVPREGGHLAALLDVPELDREVARDGGQHVGRGRVELGQGHLEGVGAGERKDLWLGPSEREGAN